jgi:hypothetical protein
LVTGRFKLIAGYAPIIGSLKRKRMMLREVIVCTNCKGENCTVEQLLETEKIDMEEYGRRHAFPRNVYDQITEQLHTARRFLITCQDCGHQHEFMERVEPPLTARFDTDVQKLVDRSLEMLDVYGIDVGEKRGKIS